MNIVETLHSRNLRITTAESCTGGLISATITSISGSSDVFDCGFVTYSNQAKIDMLGVNPKTLEQFGAVSAETAREMAEGALKKSNADIAISVTGIAGPTGGSADKPVGLVYIGISTRTRTNIYKHNFSGSRDDVRKQTVEAAFNHALSCL